MMRLIDAEKLWLTTEYTEDGKEHKYYEQFEVDNAPTIEAVSVGTLEQFIWERDLAIEQLNEIGKDLGSKMDDVITVVRCKDCILDREAECPMRYATEADDYCSYGERMEEK